MYKLFETTNHNYKMTQYTIFYLNTPRNKNKRIKSAVSWE